MLNYNELSSSRLGFIFKKQVNCKLNNIVCGDTMTIDLSHSNINTITLTGNTTINKPLNPVPGGTYLFILKQDATGSHTVAFDSVFKWVDSSSPIITATANKVDIVSCVFDGEYYYCGISQNF